MELLKDFGDEALLLGIDPWTSMDFRDTSKIYADKTRANQELKLAANVETGVDVSMPLEMPDKLLSKRRQHSQRPQNEMGKTSTAATARILAAKNRSSRGAVSGDS